MHPSYPQSIVSLLAILSCCTAVSEAEDLGPTNLLPPELTALDDASAMKQLRYLRGGKDFAEHPERYCRLLSGGAYRGSGCLEMNSYRPDYGFLVFRSRKGNYRKGERYVASAYVRSEQEASLTMFIANLTGLTSLSKLRDKPDWGDDRIEFFLNVLGIPRMPTYYLSINAFGVLCDYCLGGPPWDPPVEVATSRAGDGWIVEARLPLSSFGKSRIFGEVWRMNIGRHHRTSHTVSTQLICSEQGFHDPPHFDNILFKRSEAPDGVEVVCFSRGDLTPLGNRVGTNRAVYRVRNRSPKAIELAFTIESEVGGKTVNRTSLMRTVGDRDTTVEQFYEVKGEAGETVIFRVNRDSGEGPLLFHSGNQVDKIRKYRTVWPLADPLFEPLLDRDRVRNPRSNGFIMWGMPVSRIEYYAALQFGMARSYEEVRRECSEAGMHFLSSYVARLPCVQKDWADRFERRHNPGFERQIEERRSKGLTGPILYAPYYIIGVDNQGREGTNVFHTGFLPDPVNRKAFVESVRATVEKLGDAIWAVCAGDEQIARQMSNSMKYLAKTPREDNPFPFLDEADVRVIGAGYAGVGSEPDLAVRPGLGPGGPGRRRQHEQDGQG